MSPDELKRFPIFVELSEEERELLAEILEKRALPDGKSAFREGAESEGLVLLAEGRLKLKSRRKGGVVGHVEAPWHLGSASLFAPGKREVSALADGPATVWMLSRSGLSRLVEDAPRAAYRIAEAVSVELSGLVREGLETLVERDLG